MSHEKSFDLFVDHVKYTWPDPMITGKELRDLASIPESAEIFLRVPGKPDLQIKDDTEVDLEKHGGVPHFSTQSTGSQAG